MQDSGKLILRLALGVMILLHGVAKVVGGIGGVSGMVVANGLPAFVAYGVYVGEVLAPILVITGCFSRIGGWLIAINMAFAFGLVHRDHLFELAGTGGWALELQGMYFFTAIAIALLGPGRHSINNY
mgnify:CR=1 FL=1